MTSHGTIGHMPRWLIVVLAVLVGWALLVALDFDTDGVIGALALVAVVFVGVALYERAPDRRR